MPNTHLQGGELVQRINEIESFVNIRHRILDLPEVAPIPIPISEETTPKLDMVELGNRPLKEYAAPSRAELHSCISPPAIEENNFELKPSLLQAVQQNQFSEALRIIQISIYPCSYNTLTQ